MGVESQSYQSPLTIRVPNLDLGIAAAVRQREKGVRTRLINQF
jgi:hypothetical protein